MGLIDLNPKWLSADMFAFDCPHCGKVRLTCKRVVMSIGDQMKLWEEQVLKAKRDVVPCEQACAWVFPASADFASITVTPSLDASKSGHWHGFITNGQVV